MLFGIDFDDTMIAGHTNNILDDACVNDPTLINDTERQWLLVKDLPLIGSKEEWQNLFETLIKRGHKCAIVSYSGFSPIIQRVLKEKLELKAEILAQICIVSYLPEDQTSGKYMHMKIALQQFVNLELQKCGYNASRLPDQKTVNFIRNSIAMKLDFILVDDSPINIFAAKRDGIRTITATPDGAHLRAVLKIEPWEEKQKKQEKEEKKEEQTSSDTRISALSAMQKGYISETGYLTFSQLQALNAQALRKQPAQQTVAAVPSNSMSRSELTTTTTTTTPTPIQPAPFISNAQLINASPLAYRLNKPDNDLKLDTPQHQEKRPRR